MPYSISLSPAGFRSDAATGQLFGGNVIFTRDFVDQGGPFEWVVDTLGLQTLRFPGGTVTETLFQPGQDFVDFFFDVTNPDGFAPDGGGRILTTPALFQFAAARDLPVKYVLPTDGYLSSLTDADGHRLPSPFGLYRLIDRADRMIRGEYGEVTIDTFLVGNEFWYLDQRQTPVEYGRFANEVVKGLQFVFDRYREELDDPDSWVEPRIAVQAGRGWVPAENTTVINQLDMDARASIDTVLQHFYPVYYQHVANSRGVFDRLDEWQNAEGFGDLTFYMSEWNVFMSAQADKGLMQASTLLETMRTMMIRGIDEATIWGIQYEQLNGRLATLSYDTAGNWTSTLTAGGELFRMMNPSLVGTRVLDIDTPAALRSHLLERPEDRPEGARDQAVMHAWGSDDRTVIFLSSRTDTEMQFTLDVNGLIPDWHHVWQLQMGVLDNPATPRDEGDPTVNWARPYLTTESGGTFGAGGTFDLTLNPWEVVRLEFTTGDLGVRMWSQESIVDPAADYDDLLVGSRNNDTIFGGVGDDTLYGEGGDDILVGWWGDNQIFGGAGDDLLVAGDGRNQLEGGTGIDHFAVSVRGQTVIRDFAPDRGETLSFLGHYDTVDEVLARASVGAHSGTGPAQDLFITHDNGGETVLLGAARFANILADSLSDFDPQSEVVEQLQTMGLYEVPLELPPLPEPSVNNPALLNDLVRQATDGSLADFQEALDRFTPDELAAFVNEISPTNFALYATTAYGMLLNRLEDDLIDSFFSRLWEGNADVRVSFLLENNIELLIDNPRAFEQVIRQIGPELGAEIASNPAQNYQAYLSRVFQLMQSRGIHPDELRMFENVDVQSDALGNYFVLQVVDPLPPTPPPPPPDDDDDPLSAPPPPSLAGAGCFVATAVYGDGDHPDVAALRWFRYSVLARSGFGRALCHVYYHHAGPFLAARLAHTPRLRRAIRATLTRIARMIRHRHGAAVWPGRGTDPTIPDTRQQEPFQTTT